MATDYDASRKTDEEQKEESLEARRLTSGEQDKTSGKVDEDEAEASRVVRAPRCGSLAREPRHRGDAAAGRRVHLHRMLPRAARVSADLTGRRSVCRLRLNS